MPQLNISLPSGWAFVSTGVCLVAFSLLAALAVAGWFCERPISGKAFRRFRNGLAIAVSVFAVITFCRLLKNVALPRALPDRFIPELMGYSAFWTLAPPIWFFVEYLWVQSNRIEGARADQSAATVKNYADYASKIWAAVLALMVAMVALKKDPPTDTSCAAATERCAPAEAHPVNAQFTAKQ